MAAIESLKILWKRQEKPSFLLQQAASFSLSCIFYYFSAKIALSYFPEYKDLEFMLKPAMLFFVALVWLHEMGHFFGFKRFGIDTFGPILFAPIGGIAIPKRWPEPEEAIFSCLAGPLTGLLAIPLLIIGAVTNNHYLLTMCMFWASVNLMNALPLFPFDGGQVLAVTLTCIHKKAVKFWKILSFVIIIAGISYAATKVARENAVLLAIQAAVVLFMWYLDEKLTKVVINLLKNQHPPKRERLAFKEGLVFGICYILIITALALVVYHSWVQLML